MPFTSTHPETFRPFAGKYRVAYAAALSRLHAGLFAPEAVDAPRREEVLSEIASALEGAAASPEASQGGFHLTAAEAYGELCDTGWIEEERDGWVVRVEVPPVAARLLDALCGDGPGGTFGGTMVSVHSNLEAAAADPGNRAQGVAEAARRAREFARHMRMVVSTLRGIERDMRSEATMNGLVRTFFDSFVERVVIRDYRALTAARSHPYGYKYAIADIASAMASDGEAMAAMARALVAQGAAASEAEANAALSRDLQSVLSALDSIETLRHRIDTARASVERRFGNSLRYMELLESGDADRFTSALAAFAKGREPRMPTGLLEPVVFLDSAHLPVPLVPRRAVENLRHREAQADPLRIAFERAKADFDRRMTLTPEKLMDYVRAQMRSRTQVSAAEIPPGDLEELAVFSALRALPPSRVGLPDGFALVRMEGRVSNEWLDIGDFIITRERKGDGHAHRS